MTVSLPPQSEQHTPSLQPTGWLRYFSFSVDHKAIPRVILSLVNCMFQLANP